MNPVVIVILIILLIVGVITGGLFLLFAPEIMAAILIAGVAVLVLIKGDFLDPKIRVGVAFILIAIAIMIYFYGNELLAVVA